MAIAPHKKFREFDAALGRVIASKRQLRSLSQADLSDRAGIPLTNIGRVEKGTRSVSVAELETIAEAIQVPARTMAEEALDLYGGLTKLMSEATGTTNDIDIHRKKRAASMTTQQIEDQVSAATRDPELNEDEAEAP